MDLAKDVDLNQRTSNIGPGGHRSQLLPEADAANRHSLAQSVHSTGRHSLLSNRTNLLQDPLSHSALDGSLLLSVDGNGIGVDDFFAQFDDVLQTAATDMNDFQGDHSLAPTADNNNADWNDFEFDWGQDLPSKRVSSMKGDKSTLLSFHDDASPFNTSSHQDQVVPHDQGDDYILPEEHIKQRRRHRARMMLVDEEIELSRDALLAMRASTSQELRDHCMKMRKRKADEEELALVTSLMENPSTLSRTMRDFWRRTVHSKRMRLHGAVGKAMDISSEFVEMARAWDDQAMQEFEYGYDAGVNFFDDPEEFRDDPNRRLSTISDNAPWMEPQSVMSKRSNDTLGSDADFTFERQRISIGSAGDEVKSSPLKDIKGVLDPMFDLPQHAFDEHTFQNEHEKESLRFYSYTKGIMSSADSNEAYFFDLIQKETCSRKVAASAFHHVLFLTTKGMIHVEQSSPFQDIRLSLPF